MNLTINKRIRPYLDVLLVALIWLLSLAGIYVAGLIVFSVVTNTRPEGLFKDLLFSLADGSSAVIVVICICFLFSKKSEIKSVLSPKPESVLKTLTISVLTAMSLIFLNRYLNLEISQFKNEGEPAALSILWKQGTLTSRIMLGFLLMKIFALIPFCEELAFRFYFLESLRKDFGNQWAAIISSLVYAILVSHISNISGLVLIFGVGLAFSFLYLRYQNLLPSFLLNASIRGGAYYIVLFMN